MKSRSYYRETQWTRNKRQEPIVDPEDLVVQKTTVLDLIMEMGEDAYELMVIDLIRNPNGRSDERGSYP